MWQARLQRAGEMQPIVDHIQVTVRDMAVAVPFYDKLLPLLGFSLERKTSAVIDAHDFHVVEYIHPRMGFATTSPRTSMRDEPIHRRRPGSLHHLAFWTESRAEVDRLYVELKGIGAVIVTPPREYPEYTPAGYYAVFFKDLERIKDEIVNAGLAQSKGRSRLTWFLASLLLGPVATLVIVVTDVPPQEAK